jgi:Thiolase, C-terminal domain
MTSRRICRYGPDLLRPHPHRRLMTTLVHHMRDNGIRCELQVVCEGGGQANAAIL